MASLQRPGRRQNSTNAQLISTNMIRRNFVWLQALASVNSGHAERTRSNGLSSVFTPSNGHQAFLHGQNVQRTSSLEAIYSI